MAAAGVSGWPPAGRSSSCGRRALVRPRVERRATGLGRDIAIPRLLALADRAIGRGPIRLARSVEHGHPADSLFRAQLPPKFALRMNLRTNPPGGEGLAEGLRGARFHLGFPGADTAGQRAWAHERAGWPLPRRQPDPDRVPGVPDVRTDRDAIRRFAYPAGPGQRDPACNGAGRPAVGRCAVPGVREIVKRSRWATT